MALLSENHLPTPDGPPSGGKQVMKDFPQFYYDSDLMRLIATEPIQATLASYFLGLQHQISSGNQNIFFKNLLDDISYFYAAGGVKDQSIPANQDASGLIGAFFRQHSDLLIEIPTNGTPDTGTVDAISPGVPLPSNAAVFSAAVKLAEVVNIGDIIYYSVFDGGPSGQKVFEQRCVCDINYAVDDIYQLWFDSPSEAFVGFEPYAEIRRDSNTGTHLQVRNGTIDPLAAFGLINIRSFADVDVITQPLFDENLAGTLNTAPFTPTADYQPATVKFVQDLIASCAGFKGVYADLAALQAAHPTSELGSIATVTSPDGNLFYWNGSAWEDTGTGYIGDMLKLIYDPTGVNGDSFSMSNMNEGPTAKILTDVERTNLGNQSGTNTGDQDISGKANRDGDALTSATVNGVDLKTDQGVSKFLDGNGGYTSPGAMKYAELYADVVGSQKLKNQDEVIVFSTSGLSNSLIPNVAGNYIEVVDDGNYDIQYQGSAVSKKDVPYNFWIQVNGVLREDIGCIEVADDNMCHPFSFGRMLSLLTGDEVTIIGQCDSSTDKDWKHQLGTRFKIIKLS